MTSTAANPARLSVNAKALPADILAYGLGWSALGWILVAQSSEGVCAVLLGDDKDALEADLAQRFPDAQLRADGNAVRNALLKVIRFLDDPSAGLDLTLDLRGTPFQRRVWTMLKAIPVGTTLTYTELGRLLGDPHAARAVASACAANPVALAIPCHRIVRSNGKLAGYRWGIERKRALLQKEAAA